MAKNRETQQEYVKSSKAVPIGHSAHTNHRKTVQATPFAGNSPVVNSNASPLMSLHAVVIDTETTGH